MRKIVFLFNIIFSILGCKDNQVIEINKLFGVSFKGKIEYINRYDEWDNFNGNGYTVIIYRIKSNDMNLIVSEIEEAKGFKYIDIKEYDNDFILPARPYLKGKIYYKNRDFDNKYYTIIIDTDNKIMVYCYILT